MAVLLKDVLEAGTFHTPEGQEVRISSAEVDQLHSRVGEFARDGLFIPACWEHQPDILADKKTQIKAALADKSKQTLGWVDQAVMSGDRLNFLMDVPDTDDSKKVQKVRYCSPYIARDWVDGSGKKWPGWSILHLAVTNRPVWKGQRPFIPISLSQNAPSLNDLPESHLLLATTDDGSRAAVVAKRERDEEIPPAGNLASLIKLLKRVGLPVPSDTNAANLIERLATACMVWIERDEKDKETQMYPGTVPPIEGDPGSLLTSGYAMSQNQTATEKRVEVLTNMVIKAARDKALERANSLRLPEEDRKSVVKKVSEAKFSLNDAGEVDSQGVLTLLDGLEMGLAHVKPMEFNRRGVAMGQVRVEDIKEKETWGKEQQDNLIKEMAAVVNGQQ